MKVAKSKNFSPKNLSASVALKLLLLVLVVLAVVNQQDAVFSNQLGETGDEEDVDAELRGKITSLTEELEAARKEAETLKQRVTTYQKLAKDNEDALARLTEASNSSKKSQEEELEKLKSQLEVAHAEKANDLAAQRGERAKALEELNEKVSELQSETNVVVSNQNPMMTTNVLLSKSLLRTSGNGWQINSDPHADGHTFECKWLDFKANASGKTAKFCGHAFSDGITSTIEKKKHFHHCNVLPGMWKDTQSVRTERSIYVEIGANIGSCVMEMLLSTDANIVAFEPHPRNIFNLRSSIAALDKSYQDRVVIVPVGLGAESVSNTIFAASGNMGNSVIGKVIKDNKRQEFKEEDQFSIRVERLDSIISDYPDIALIKMDAQGFECNILDGISQDLANAIKKVKFEVSLNHLPKHGCRDLFAKFRNLGFGLTLEGGKKVEGEYTQFNRMTEMVAVRE